MIVDAYKAGEGYSAISKRFAVSRTAVKSIIAKVKETHSVKNKVGRGRKRKISQFLERKIVREVQKNQRTTTKMIVKDLANSEVDVSRSTVKRVLHRNALRDCRPRKTPLLKKRHLQARLKYARDLTLTLEQFAIHCVHNY